MVTGFNSNKLVDVLPEKSVPVVGGDKNNAIFCPSELADVHCSERVDNFDKVSHPHLLWCACICKYGIELCLIDVFLQTCRLRISLLQEPETPVGGEFSMPGNHE